MKRLDFVLIAIGSNSNKSRRTRNHITQLIWWKVVWCGTEKMMTKYLWYCCCCSVTQSCPALWDRMDLSTPGFPVLHYPLELAQTHVLWVRDPIQPWLSSVVPFSSCLQSFPESGSFLMSWFFISGAQSIGASASASVLPMNIQDWFSLGLTGWISLQSKGLSRVFSMLLL